MESGETHGDLHYRWGLTINPPNSDNIIDGIIRPIDYKFNPAPIDFGKARNDLTQLSIVAAAQPADGTVSIVPYSNQLLFEGGSADRYIFEVDVEVLADTNEIVFDIDNKNAGEMIPMDTAVYSTQRGT